MHVLHSERYPDLIGLRGVVVAESKGCLFLANYCKAHKESRSRQQSGREKKMDTVSAEDGNACTVRGDSNSGEVPGDKEIAATKKAMKVARVVKEDSVLAVVVTVSESCQSQSQSNGEDIAGKESEGSDSETALQLLRRVCHSDLTTLLPPCGDEQKKGRTYRLPNTWREVSAVL